MAAKKVTHKAGFERKFGAILESAIPSGPGVYLFYDLAGALIYVGKAKNLRRRLGQYRNAKRRKKSMKMRAIIADAERLEFRACKGHLEACLEETALIQKHRPRFNIAGAFHFLYPMIGFKRVGPDFFLCYTNEPEKLPGYSFQGCYRSRFLTRNAFHSLCSLLAYVGHRMKKKFFAPKFSYVVGFRMIPRDWDETWDRFWRGESTEALEQLVLAMLENAGARRKSALVQKDLDHLRRFWRDEITPLSKARKASPGTPFPVPQAERDALFLRYRLKDERQESSAPCQIEPASLTVTG